MFDFSNIDDIKLISLAVGNLPEQKDIISWKVKYPFSLAALWIRASIKPSIFFNDPPLYSGDT